MKKAFFLVLSIILFVPLLAAAQPRPVDKTPAPVPQNLPASFKARYDGGIFGSSGKETGALPAKVLRSGWYRK